MSSALSSAFFCLLSGLFLFPALSRATCGSLGCITLTEVFDTNANGLQDAGEILIPGWQVQITSYATSKSILVNASGNVTNLPIGLYGLCDSNPVQSSNWYRTPYGATCYRNVTVVANKCVSVAYTRLLLGPGNVSTLLEWETTPYLNSLTAADLAALTSLDLKYPSGAHFVGLSSTVFLNFIAPTQTVPVVPLGSTSTYAILSGTDVTSTGATVVNGNLGIYPGTSLTGFGPGVIHGTAQLGTAAALTAQSDLTIAYNNAVARGPPIAILTDLGGQTLAPGDHNTATGISVTGTVTLDAQGNSDAVFVLQAGSTILLAAGANVLLINGAQASNVFWSAGSSATLNAGSNLVGTLLAHVSISLAIGATVTGRLLCSTGGVTLISNTITVPPATSALALSQHSLSVELALIELNTRRRTLTNSTYVSAPTIVSLVNNGLYFQTVQTLINFANYSLSLTNSSANASSDATAAYSSLVGLYANNTIVQAQPGKFSFAVASAKNDTLAC